MNFFCLWNQWNLGHVAEYYSVQSKHKGDVFNIQFLKDLWKYAVKFNLSFVNVYLWRMYRKAEVTWWTLMGFATCNAPMKLSAVPLPATLPVQCITPATTLKDVPNHFQANHFNVERTKFNYIVVITIQFWQLPLDCFPMT